VLPHPCLNSASPLAKHAILVNMLVFFFSRHSWFDVPASL
jgi:hypothetical protein